MIENFLKDLTAEWSIQPRPQIIQHKDVNAGQLVDRGLFLGGSFIRTLRLSCAVCTLATDSVSSKQVRIMALLK